MANRKSSRISRPRAKNSRPPLRTIQVFAEGLVTERDCLRHVCPAGVRIEFAPVDGFSPMRLAQAARAAKKADQVAKERRFDEFWCVFDYDEHANLKQALHEAREGGVKAALSNPCLELWLVLQEIDQIAHIDRKAIQKQCETLDLIAGRKGKRLSEKGRKLFKAQFERAKERAKDLERGHRSAGECLYANPSSGVWRLVDDLNQA